MKFIEGRPEQHLCQLTDPVHLWIAQKKAAQFVVPIELGKCLGERANGIGLLLVKRRSFPDGFLNFLGRGI